MTSSDAAELELTTDSVPVLISYIDSQERFRRLNRAYEAFFGIKRDALLGVTVRAAGGEEHYAIAKPHIQLVLTGTRTEFDSVVTHRDGSIRHIHVTYTPDVGPDGGTRGFVAMVQDVTESKRSQALLVGQKSVLELITQGKSLNEALGLLCHIIEAWTTTGGRASILLVEGGKLRLGAAPSLPDAYNQAIDGAPVGPDVGACGKAAHFGCEFVTQDMENDPFWKPFLSLTVPARLAACWSIPILDGSGGVLGTFALYFPKPSLPDPSDRQVLTTLGQTAAVAITRKRADDELNAVRSQSSRILESITDAFYALDTEWRFTYVNNAAERVLLRSREDLIGKIIWEEFAPATETTIWHEYHRAREERRSVQFELFYAPLETWFILHAYPSPEGLSVYFHEINDKKRSELREAFLRSLDDSIRPLSEPAQITLTAAELLGRHLHVNRCAYADVEDDQDTFNLTGDFNQGVASIVGRYRFAQFGAECLRLMRAGEPYIVEDAETDPRTAEVVDSYRQISMQSVVCVPLHKESRFVAAMAVHQTTPRVWRTDEVELLQQVANRCWESFERARAERDLRRSEDQFRSLANTIPNLAWMVDPQGQNFWFNQRWHDYTGVSAQQVREEGWGGIIRHDVLPTALTRWEESLRSGRPFEMVFPMRGTDGAFRPFLTRVEPMKDAEGQVVRWFGTNTDIEAQQKAEERLRSVVVGSPFPIMLHAQDGEILALSRSWNSLTGYSPEELRTHQEWVRVAFPDKYAEVMAQIQRHFETEAILPIGETAVTIRNGQQRIWDLQVVPLGCLEDGRRLQMTAAMDVTERHRAEEVLRASNEDLRRANEELEEFAYVASHDMQEPLRMVNIFTQLLLDRHVPAENTQAADFARTIRSGVQRMEALIRDLLSYSRVVHTKDAAGGVADLSKSLAHAVSVLQNRIEETGAIIENDVLPTVRGDQAQFSYVFQNLLSNALKYRRLEDAPVIHISSRQERNEWIVSIRDNGIGFDPQYRERIFGLFKRLHKDAYPGTGLGLAICKRIVERYGGRIWAEGAPGLGATFSFAASVPEQTPLAAPIGSS